MKFTPYKCRKTGKKLWRIDLTICGQRIRRGEFETKSEAAAAVSALKLKARSLTYGYAIEETSITIGELIKERKKNPRYKHNAKTRVALARFLKIVPEQTPVERLAKSHLRAFLTACEKEELQASSINIYLSEVLACLNAASEYFPELEDWTPPRIKKLREGPGRSRVLLPDEISKLLQAFRAEKQRYEHPRTARRRHEVHDIMRLMLLTGAREGEILKLEQSAINWTWRTVTITSRKGVNGMVRTIPLSDLALEILRERQTEKQRFFCLTAHQLNTCFTRAGQIAGIPTGQKTTGGWVFYDLRHTAASVLEINGIPYSTVSAILGHKRPDMTARYTHSNNASMREAVELLEGWCRLIDGFVEHSRTQDHIPHTKTLLVS